MAEYKGSDFLDFLYFIVKRKKFLLVFAASIAIVSYLMIYFLIPPQYDSDSTIVAVEDSNLNAAGLLSETIKNIPLTSLGLGNLTSTDKYNFFNTIIYSKTFLKKIIEKFDLMGDYKVDEIEDAYKILAKKINTDITDEDAFIITVRASSPEKSARMTNYIVGEVNDQVIALNTRKSRENKKFLADRYGEIKQNLYAAEDSLKFFQEKYGFLVAEDQTKASIEAYTKLESELAEKQIESSVYDKLLGSTAPQTRTSKIAVDEYRSRLNDLKTQKNKNRLILPISSLPENAQKYYRYFRNVEIYNAMLQFIIPIYEQAKFDAVKDIPVLQIIDKAYPPIKKSFPPRLIFTIIITFFVTGLMIFMLYTKELMSKSINPKVILLREELFRFRGKASREQD